jgi:proteasome lid subunit RPN8/RPN11
MSDALQLVVSAELAEKIRAHGVETYPHECCGALFGREVAGGEEQSSDAAQEPLREVLALFPLVNRRDDSPRNRFSVTPEDVLLADKAARQQGLDVVGWYHSHPDHPARPSQYDQDHAWPWYSYIIVTVHAGAAKEMTSWRLKDDRSAYVEERIATVHANAAG